MINTMTECDQCQDLATVATDDGFSCTRCAYQCEICNGETANILHTRCQSCHDDADRDDWEASQIDRARFASLETNYPELAARYT